MSDQVPGMADAIEKRRKELHLTPGEMIDRSGLTEPGWVPIRRGERRRYQDKTRRGVARALQWEPDAIDRLLDGKKPVPLKAPLPAEPPPPPLDHETIRQMMREELQAVLAEIVAELRKDIPHLRDG